MASRVMLAANKPITDEILQRHLDEVGFLWMQPKIDGMRTYIGEESIPQTRAGKEWKHKPLRALAQAMPSLRGKDGEIVPGHVYSESSFREAMSGIRAADGTREFTFFLFDNVHMADFNYLGRYRDIVGWCETHGEFFETEAFHARIVPTPTLSVETLEEIKAKETEFLLEGWEGAMLRRPDRPYKFGRSTNLGGELIKLKRYEDAEAIVVGYEPWYTNENEPTISALGYTVRSSHQEGKVPLERLGALVVELLTDRSIKFKIGVMKGITHAERDRLWQQRETLIGRICKFKHQGYGGYDGPRQPVFLNWRLATEF